MNEKIRFKATRKIEARAAEIPYKSHNELLEKKFQISWQKAINGGILPSKVLSGVEKKTLEDLISTASQSSS